MYFILLYGLTWSAKTALRRFLNEHWQITLFVHIIKRVSLTGACRIRRLRLSGKHVNNHSRSYRCHFSWADSYFTPVQADQWPVNAGRKPSWQIKLGLWFRTKLLLHNLSLYGASVVLYGTIKDALSVSSDQNCLHFSCNHNKAVKPTAVNRSSQK